MKKNEIPQFVLKIIETIEKAGYEAYLVGGCVRDILLGRIPSDWDIASSASPFDIMRIFNKTVPTGLKFGTVTVILEDKKAEVTTFRNEKGYDDCRRPKDVVFVKSIDQDLSRRDFTVNAMAYNPKTGIVDPFCGKEDLENKIIRAVGEPSLRFEEDALRILRAFRFSAQLGFEIEKSTLDSCFKAAKNVEKISGERKKAELDKILLSDRPQHIAMVLESKALELIFKKEDSTADLEILQNVEKNLSSRWAAFLFLEEIEDLTNVFKMLRFSNEEKEDVTFFVNSLKNKLPKNKIELKICLSKGMAIEKYAQFLNLCIALKIEKAENILVELSAVIENREPFSLKQLALTGNDLIKMGFNKGPACGKMLNMLLKAVIAKPSLNDKKTLIETANSLKQVH